MRWAPQEVVWSIDYRPAFEIRAGRARDRAHPQVRGEARISESDWRSLERILIEGLLRWPRCAVTGPQPYGSGSIRAIMKAAGAIASAQSASMWT
jgi:hypothetical protein